MISPCSYWAATGPVTPTTSVSERCAYVWASVTCCCIVASGLNSRNVTIVDVCPRTRASRSAALAGETVIAAGMPAPFGIGTTASRPGMLAWRSYACAARAALFTAEGGRPRGSRCTMAMPASSG